MQRRSKWWAYAENKPCVPSNPVEYMKQWRIENPGKAHRYQMATCERVNKTRSSLGQACEICGIRFTHSSMRAQDHCHETNTIRGELCQSCNKMLGFAKDNPFTLISAAHYLNAYRERTISNIEIIS